ncbi:hypothetical protein PIB30_028701 [Stylosanthes scabra]|uniref:Uncharacterized protein n=1 Tax=Stylosanthes scabra TaxID=79078 RepID=A0ABU6UCT6_9FABA|nr:hypothetical protein [Stylosanthes scabra]
MENTYKDGAEEQYLETGPKKRSLQKILDSQHDQETVPRSTDVKHSRAQSKPTYEARILRSSISSGQLFWTLGLHGPKARRGPRSHPRPNKETRTGPTRLTNHPTYAHKAISPRIMDTQVQG